MSSPKTERNKEIVKKVKAGLSYAKVGEFFNIRKQTVHEIYVRELKKLAKTRSKRSQELSTV